MIVQNALKLYSEDRIGLVDYALESGGTVLKPNAVVMVWVNWLSRLVFVMN